MMNGRTQAATLAVRSASACWDRVCSLSMDVHKSPPPRPGLHQHIRPHLSAWAVYRVWPSHSLGSPVFFQQIGGKLSSAAICAGWLNGHAHKSPPLQFHQLQTASWKEPLPSCWRSSYGIIYNPPQSPQPFVDSHRAINTNDIQLMSVYITVKYGESQANSSIRLKTRGLQWYDSANVAGFQWSQEPQDVGGKDNPVPEATTILMKIWRPSENFWFKMMNTGLKSGSREISLTEALKSGLRTSGSKRINFSQVRV